MRFLCFIYGIVNVINVVLADETKIVNYFNSDTFKTIQKQWEIERESFENALVLILEQNYGRGAINVYVRKMPDSYKISDGFYFSDSIVDLVLLETRLIESPNLIAPDVTFALASNYLHTEARLGKIILSTDYILIRNQSDLIFTGSEQDATKNSPFTFQQVQDSGELTITAQDCYLVGHTITTFNGNSVNLGMDTFKVTKCKFSVEIYATGLGSPPVFGPYFSQEQSLALEAMLSIPIRAELMPKLQAAVFTYVNTSAIFGDQLPQLRHHQNTVFKETSRYMNVIVENYVKNTIKNTKSILKLKPLEISWNKTCVDGSCGSVVRLNDVILYGLDTAYSAHIGGPYKVQSTKVAETIRFSTMQVRGKIHFENTTVKGEFEFAVELRDIAVNVEMEKKSSSFVLVREKIDFVGWRTIDFSILELDQNAYERRASQAFVTGYLINEIPKQLTEHISKNFGNIDHTNEQQTENINSDKGNRDKDKESKELDKSKDEKKNSNNKGKKQNYYQNQFSDPGSNSVSDGKESSVDVIASDTQSLSQGTDNEDK